MPGGPDRIDADANSAIRSQEPVVCDPELDDFVAKPFRPFELLGCVWKVLRGNQPYPRLDIAR